MKTFRKLTAQSPAASYVPLPRFLLQDEALRDISNDAKVLYTLLLDRASISWQNGYAGPNGTIWLYFNLGTGTDKAPLQPLERHANLPGIGVQRFDRSAQAGPGQARPHHAELPGGRKTHSVEILEYVFESLARSLLLVIQEYYESEDGKKVFAEWKAKKENRDCAST